MKSVTIYYKGYCPYCKAALNFLTERNVPHNAIDAELPENQTEFENMKEKYNHRTVPLILIGDEFIGGNDDMMALHAKGEFLPKVS